MKYRVKVNDSLSHDIELENGTVMVNGISASADVAFIAGNKYHILSENKSFMMEVLENDIAAKKFTIKVNDQEYQLSVEDQLDILLDKMGMSAIDKSKADDIKAPMPGLVLKILVEPGQSVVKGDSLIILEAMKMENVIKASGAGVVMAINVKEKDAVEKNHLLIEMS
jgi:biotin carboxyl carrier protein